MSRLALSCRWLSSACFSDTISSSMALVVPREPSEAPAQPKRLTAKSNQRGRISGRALGRPTPRRTGASRQLRRGTAMSSPPTPHPRPTPHPQPPAVGPLPEGSRERGGAAAKPAVQAPPRAASTLKETATAPACASPFLCRSAHLRAHLELEICPSVKTHRI